MSQPTFVKMFRDDTDDAPVLPLPQMAFNEAEAEVQADYSGQAEVSMDDGVPILDGPRMEFEKPKRQPKAQATVGSDYMRQLPTMNFTNEK